VALAPASTWCPDYYGRFVHMPANANCGRSSISANQTISFFLVTGFGPGAYSAKLLSKLRITGVG
jgi:hypothetical protein